jgi:hypothetical protein
MYSSALKSRHFPVGAFFEHLATLRKPHEVLELKKVAAIVILLILFGACW